MIGIVLKILTQSLAAAGLTAAVLTVGVIPAQAATIPAPVSHTAAPSTTAVSVSVDVVRAGDNTITGHVIGDATTVSIEGILPGRPFTAPVAADGSFSIDIATFASRIRPMQTLMAFALDVDGIKIAQKQFLVEFKAPPQTPTPERDLLVDRVSTDSKTITGTATPGTTVLLDGISGARPGAMVTKDGKYSISIASFALTAGQTLTAVNVDSSTLQPLGKQKEIVVVGSPDDSESSGELTVDPLHLGMMTLTGTAPADAIHVAVDIFGTSEFGTLDAAGNYSIPLARVAYMLRPGVKISVWSMNAEGLITETAVTVVR